MVSRLSLPLCLQLSPLNSSHSKLDCPLFYINGVHGTAPIQSHSLLINDLIFAEMFSQKSQPSGLTYIHPAMLPFKVDTVIVEYKIFFLLINV